MEKPSETKEDAQVIDIEPQSMPIIALILLYAIIWAMREACTC